jgi:cation diffusion facilitator CzcD-associated flavoprotein CzcO
MPQPPRTCVIGAGISGLTSSKILLDYGIAFDTFESSDRIGGNWAFRNPNGHSSAYRSLHIDTSKDMLRFRDYPMPEHFPDFPHHTEIKEYLEGYADAFGLRERIQFETGVERCERRPGGGWEVTTQDGSTHAYDVVVVANGHHWNPRMAAFEGSFDGEQLHSHHYIDPTEPLDLRNKRIVVVGIGNSAADIASELSHKSWGNTTFISTRSSAWVVPKYLFGRPVDKIVKTIPQLPLGLQRALGRPLARVVSGRPEAFGLPTPNHRFLDAHPTVSSELLLRLGSGDLVGKPNIAALEGDRVRFEDGTVEEIDAIVYATGYDITFPFFDEDFISAPDNRIGLFKRMFHPDYDDVVFVGFAQAIPTLFPFVECQARTMAAYLAGTYRPPSPDDMRRAIAADDARFTGHFKDSARHRQQQDYHVYEHEMRTKELPAGRARVKAQGPVALARTAAAHA